MIGRLGLLEGTPHALCYPINARDDDPSVHCKRSCIRPIGMRTNRCHAPPRPVGRAGPRETEVPRPSVFEPSLLREVSRRMWVSKACDGAPPASVGTAIESVSARNGPRFLPMADLRIDGLDEYAPHCRHFRESRLWVQVPWAYGGAGCEPTVRNTYLLTQRSLINGATRKTPTRRGL